jgi:hypothetical protein
VSAVVLEQPDVNRTPRAAALSSGRNITSPSSICCFSHICTPQGRRSSNPSGSALDR